VSHDRPPVRLLPVRFHGAGSVGDFSWMRDQPDYARALFVFNDNESQFRAHLDHVAQGAGRCSAGGGNAIARPWQHDDPPRSAGVPTGDHGGYPSLTPHVRAVIDEAIARIEALLATGGYDTVVYSADRQGRLGTSIFSPGDDVVDHITGRLRALAEPPR
jgi:hypothetical protein